MKKHRIELWRVSRGILGEDHFLEGFFFSPRQSMPSSCRAFSQAALMYPDMDINFLEAICWRASFKFSGSFMVITVSIPLFNTFFLFRQCEFSWQVLPIIVFWYYKSSIFRIQAMKNEFKNIYGITTCRMNTSDLSNGIYLVKITFKNKSFLKKLVISH